MIYVLKLDGDEKVTDIAYTGNEEDVITFLLSNELGQDNDDKRMLELMIRTSFKDGGGYFFYVRIYHILYCAIDPYLPQNQNRDIHNSFLEYVKQSRDNKLKEIGI